MNIVATTANGHSVMNFSVDTSMHLNTIGIDKFINVTDPHSINWTGNTIVLNYRDDTTILLIRNNTMLYHTSGEVVPNHGSLRVTFRNEEALVEGSLYFVSGTQPPKIGADTYEALVNGPERRMFLGNMQSQLNQRN